MINVYYINLVIQFLKSNDHRAEEIKSKLETSNTEINRDIYRFKLESIYFFKFKKPEEILSFHLKEISLFKMVLF